MDDDQPNEAPKQIQPPALPPPLKPSNVLDSIFKKKGPMPAASVGIRSLAFLLDFVLLYLISMLIVYKIGWPANYPGAYFELEQWMHAILAWTETGSTQATPPEMNAGLMAALGYALNLMFIIFWVYFAVGEAFFGGSSLGKRLCCIRSVSTITLGHPPIFTGIVRGGLKTTSIFIVFPISAPITLVALFFNKRGQFLHDLLSRTAVVDERSIHRNG